MWFNVIKNCIFHSFNSMFCTFVEFEPTVLIVTYSSSYSSASERNERTIKNSSRCEPMKSNGRPVARWIKMQRNGTHFTPSFAVCACLGIFTISRLIPTTHTHTHTHTHTCSSHLREGVIPWNISPFYTKIPVYRYWENPSLWRLCLFTPSQTKPL